MAYPVRVQNDFTGKLQFRSDPLRTGGPCTNAHSLRHFRTQRDSCFNLRELPPVDLAVTFGRHSHVKRMGLLHDLIAMQVAIVGSKPEPSLAVAQSDQVKGDPDVAGVKLSVVLVAVESESWGAVLLMDGYLNGEIAVLKQPPSLRSPDKSFDEAMPMNVVVMALSAFLFVTGEACRPPVMVLGVFVAMPFFSIMISAAHELSVMVMPMSVVFIVILPAYLLMTVSVTD